jgi:methyltransferase-like protein/SAM-dependent methyltransferase
MEGASAVISGPTKYDQVPYESYPFHQSQPDRLSTMARLFGMNPTPVDKCRVLELGCASGGNLIPIASIYPESTFVGVDLSQVQVAAGQEMIKGIGLKNVELKVMSIADINKDFGEFDYIICHGVYSWVPHEVQDAILRICGENLTAQGVGYVSYNTYPGWHFRGIIREAMIYHASQFAEPAMKAAQGRALLDFLASAVPEGQAYGLMLKDEINILKNQKDYYLLHEHLEDVNYPAYFHDFIEKAQNNGLQFLSEAELSVMLTSQFPQQVRDTLNRISNEIVKTEQYIDFVRNKYFRQTLLCRKDVTLNRNLTPANIMQFYVGSPFKSQAENVDLRSLQGETFGAPNGMTITATNPLVKAALRYLGQIWPRTVAFDELFSIAQSSLASVSIKDAQTHEREKQAVAADILSLYASGFIVLRSHPSPFVTEVSQNPHASEVARFQVKTSNVLTNRVHEAVTADLVAQHLIDVCDGKRNREQILDEMVSRVKSGAINIHKEGKKVEDDAAIREIIGPMIDTSLQNLAKVCLLVS